MDDGLTDNVIKPRDLTRVGDKEINLNQSRLSDSDNEKAILKKIFWKTEQK